MRWHAGRFTLVMATGITSAAMRAVGLAPLAAVLLVVAAVSFVALTFLLVRQCWRRPSLAVDRSSPGAALGAFAFTAACAVLGRDLSTSGWMTVGLTTGAQLLAALGGVSWLALTAFVPVRMAASGRERPALADVGGTWYLGTVATQSLAIIAIFLHAEAAAVCAWLAGIVLYLVTTALVAVRLRAYGLGPPGSRASYWVAMGAASISVLAGAEVLGISDATGDARTAILAAAIALWAVASCLLPVLALRTAAVLLRGPLRPRFHPGAWLVIFPLGMYATGSMLLGQAADLEWMHEIGTALAWVAVTAGTAVFLAMIGGALAGGRRLQHHQGPVAHDDGAAGLTHGLGRQM